MISGFMLLSLLSIVLCQECEPQTMTITEFIQPTISEPLVECSADQPCHDGSCCSRYGFCGDTFSYCSPTEKCLSNCWEDDHEEMFIDWEFVDGVDYTCSTANSFSLTFSDSPAAYFEDILNALNQRNVKATFFVLGREIAGKEHLLRMAHETGHQIASQGWSHTDFTTLSTVQLKRELNNTARTIKKITGQAPRFVRPPRGFVDQETALIIKSFGYRIVLWNLDSLDWQINFEKGSGDDVANIVEVHIAKANGESKIMNMHDGYYQTAGAIDRVIDIVSSHGYEMLRVDECLQ